MSLVDEIKERVDIVAVVEQYVRLQKAGRNFRACCPFHSEKTPSFYVSPERQTWHCFGACATGGDAFSFIMKKEGVDFEGALRLLASRAGVSLDRREKAPTEGEETQRLRSINEAAADFYHSYLLQSPAAAEARRYVEKRGLNSETVANFRLGYSPPGWDNLKQHLTQIGYSDPELLAAGLLSQSEEGRTYDRFRHRLLFPVSDARGRVVGFGGRALDESLPKYLNSPQTVLFDKGGLLYGLHQAREAIRKANAAVIVEGYVDVLVAHQAGFSNVVACLGTSLTEKQVGLLKKLARSLILALDADAAGQEATLRGLEVSRQALRETVAVPDWHALIRQREALNGEIKVLLLPAGRDPDEVILENSEAWVALVRNALPVIDYVLEAVLARLDLTQAQGRVLAVQRLAPLLDEIANPAERNHYTQKLARKIGVSEKVLVETTALEVPSRRRVSAAQRRKDEPPQLPSREPLEEYCLCLLLQHPELCEPGRCLLPEHFEHAAHREIYLQWREAPNLEALREKLSESLLPFVEVLVQTPLPPAAPGGWERIFRQVSQRLEERRLRRFKAQEATILTEGETPGRAGAVARVALELWRTGAHPEAAEEDMSLARLQQEGLTTSRRLKDLFHGKPKEKLDG